MGVGQDLFSSEFTRQLFINVGHMQGRNKSWHHYINFWCAVKMTPIYSRTSFILNVAFNLLNHKPWQQLLEYSLSWWRNPSQKSWRTLLWGNWLQVAPALRGCSGYLQDTNYKGITHHDKITVPYLVVLKTLSFFIILLLSNNKPWQRWMLHDKK